MLLDLKMLLFDIVHIGISKAQVRNFSSVYVWFKKIKIHNMYMYYILRTLVMCFQDRSINAWFWFFITTVNLCYSKVLGTSRFTSLRYISNLFYLYYKFIIMRKKHYTVYTVFFHKTSIFIVQTVLQIFFSIY